MAEAKREAKSKKSKAESEKQQQTAEAEGVAEAAPAKKVTSHQSPVASKEVAEDIAKLKTDDAGPETTDVKASVAKAGKRSAKAQAEAEEKKAKEERKTTAAGTNTKSQQPKPTSKPPRTRAERAGKKYREVYQQIEAGKSYTLAEALALAAKTSPSKFDATVEMHLNLGVDPKMADQNVRGSVSLPAGTGKTLRVAVLAEGDQAAAAKKAGADTVGADELLAQLEKEDINFDVLIATPNMMPRLGKYARLLGPRGLMPNPKSGTVTSDVAKAVTEAKAGRVEYRVDPSGIVHLGIGKVSFGPEKLGQNADAVLGSIRANKPASLKGIYIRSAHLSTTMGPSIRFEI